MKEFDYDLDYKNLDFSQDINRKYYRIGRGEQGVLLVEPYKSDICKYWKFATLEQAKVSASTIYEMFLNPPGLVYDVCLQGHVNKAHRSWEQKYCAAHPI